MNFTPELNSILEKIVEQLTENGAITKRDRRLPIYEFTNPYSNQQEYLSTSFGDLYDTYIGIYRGSNSYENSGLVIQNANPDDKIHEIAINSETRNKVNEQQLRQALYHEMIHMIDPKTKLENQKQVNSREDFSGYMRTPKEFDAFSNQIANSVANSIREEETDVEEIKQWIRSPGLRQFPLMFQYNPPSMLKYFIKSIENYDDLVRRFKSSLYDLVQNLEKWDRQPTEVNEYVYQEEN